jgi:putative ABC transport system permease protein
MSVWESLRTAWQSIIANKMRSSLTMLGIVIGVCAVVLLVALGQGFQTSMTQTFNNMGASALYISSQPSRSVTVIRPLTNEDVAALADKTLAPDIAVVSPTRTTRVDVSYENSDATESVMGVLPVVTQIRNYQVDKGRFITDEDVTQWSSVAVLGWQAATDLFGTQSPVGSYIRISGMKFLVIGTCQKFGGFGGDSYILIPLSTMQYSLVGGDEVQQIGIKANTPKDVDAAIAEVTSVLRTRHFINAQANPADDFVITDMRETLNSLESTLTTFSIFMGAVGAISLLVGGIGIMNIMLVSVTERTREIGIRKAIGATRRDILVQFLVEAAALSLTGGLVGLLLALAGVRAMGHVTIGSTQVMPEISITIVIVALSVSIGTGLLSGTYPALRAARLDPIQSLRHE